MRALFFTGFIQVFLVAINTYLIAKLFWVGIAITSFLISLVWTYNVSRKSGKVSFTDTKSRLAYAFGAMLGSVVGVYVIFKIIG